MQIGLPISRHHHLLLSENTDVMICILFEDIQAHKLCGCSVWMFQCRSDVGSLEVFHACVIIGTESRNAKT
jgi:hypothetical protein